MALVACPVPGKQKAIDLCNAFIAGAPKDAEGFVFYGVKESNVAAWRRVQNMEATFYYIDNSYFDPNRGTHFRVTRNRIQHTGEGRTTGERFARTGLRIKPWRNGDSYTLIIEQSDDHMRYVAKTPGTFYRQAKHLQLTQRTRIRRWSCNKPVLMESFMRDLENASRLLTYSSAAAVMATLAGIPVDCSDECAAFSIIPFKEPDDRLRWAGVLADNEFTWAELKDGTAWRTLHPGAA